MEVELVIVRHGETEANKCHIIQGHQDTSLSELGLQQAQCVAKYLGRKYFLILVDALLNNEQRTSTNFLQKLYFHSSILWPGSLEHLPTLVFQV